MKFFFIVSLLVILAVGMTAEKLADLPDLVQPRRIHVHGERFYIATKQTICLYSMRDYKRVKTFGKKGEGPGEFKWRPMLRPAPDCVLIEDHDKIMRFSLDGVHQSDIRKPSRMFLIHPVGRNYVAIASKYNKETHRIRSDINLYDGKLELLKVISKGADERPSVFKIGQRMDVHPLPHAQSPTIHGNRIYLPDTTKGFHITVYDDQGIRLYAINRPHKKRKVPQKFKDDFLRKAKEKPNWEQVKDIANFVYPEYYPAFSGIRANDGKLYVSLFGDDEAYRNLLVLDLKGAELGRLKLPKKYRGTIADGKYYYLVEDEEEELWTLHAVNLQPVN